MTFFLGPFPRAWIFIKTPRDFGFYGGFNPDTPGPFDVKNPLRGARRGHIYSYAYTHTIRISLRLILIIYARILRAKEGPQAPLEQGPACSIHPATRHVSCFGGGLPPAKTPTCRTKHATRRGPSRPLLTVRACGPYLRPAAGITGR